MTAKRNRPGWATEAKSESLDGLTTKDTRDRAARAAFALVVLAGMANGQTRRRVMFSLPSAQAAVERTRARGLPASLHLVRLLPVPIAVLDELDLDALGGGR